MIEFFFLFLAVCFLHICVHRDLRLAVFVSLYAGNPGCKIGSRSVFIRIVIAIELW